MKKIVQKILTITALLGILSGYMPSMAYVVMAISIKEETLNEEHVEENNLTDVNNKFEENKTETVKTENNTEKDETEKNEEKDNMNIDSKNEVEDEITTNNEVIMKNIKEQPVQIMKSPANEDKIIEFDEKVKNAILDYYSDIDENNDGKISTSEINNTEVYSLNIDANNEETSLKGIENLKDLQSLSIYNFNGILDLNNTSSLSKLTYFTITGYIKNIINANALKNLVHLEIRPWSSETKISLEFIKEITSLKTLTIDGYVSNLQFISNLINLESLSLELNDEKYNDLSSLLKLKKLKTLEITNNNNNMAEIDFNSISKLNSLEELVINMFDTNIEQLKKLTNLKSLRLSNWNWIELDDDFFNTLNELDIENIDLRGRFIANLGAIEANANNEFKFDDINVIKNMLERIDNRTLKVNEWQDDGVDLNCINIDNNNNKLTITPSEENKRYIDISNENDDFEIRLQWTLSGDNETVEFSDDVKNGIINCYNDIDKNNDGNLSLAELNSREISYINIDAGSKEISLNGIENLKYLHELSIYNVRGEIDLQKLSSLPNLKRIYVSGYVTDIKNADLLNNLEELTINSWDMNYKINLDFLKKLTGLRRLEIGSYVSNISNVYGLVNLESLTLNLQDEKYNDLSGLAKLTNLKRLNINNINYVDEIDFNSISKLKSLEELSIYVSYFIEPKQEFFNELKKLNIKNIYLSGSYMANLGEIENNKNTVFKFEDVSIIKSLLDFTENKNLKIKEWQDEGVITSYANIDNNSKTVTINPKENGKKYVDISLNNGSCTIRLKWINPGDNDPVELNENVKQAILRSNPNIDENGDGILTKAELEVSWFTYLNLYLNNQEANLNGVENIKNLETININGVKGNLDFSKLKDLKKLRNLSVSGYFDNVSTLEGITQITNLSLNPYGNTEIDYSVLKNLKSLETLTVQGTNDISWTKDLINLKELNIQGNGKLDCKNFENAGNIEILSLSARNIENVSSLQKIKTLKKLKISTDEIDASQLDKITGLEKLYLSGNIENLKLPTNLKELEIHMSNYEGENYKIINMEQINLLESLIISAYGKTKIDFQGIKNNNNLKYLEIQADYTYNIENMAEISQIPNLDNLTVTIYNGNDEDEPLNISKLTNPNIKNLSIRGNFDDITPITKLTKLENVTLINKMLNRIDIEKYMKNLENIKVKYNFNIGGNLEFDIGSIKCGNNIDYDFSKVAILSKALNKNSVLYSNDSLNINYYENGSYNNERNKSKVTLKGNIVNITAEKFGNQSYDFYITRGYSYQENDIKKVNLDLTINLKWLNSIEESKTEINIPDKNLKNYLLEKYDIDGDKKITKNDIVNIESLDISNKNISNLKGLENAVNLVSLNAENNKIAELTPISSLTKLKDIDVNNNEIKSIEPLSKIENINWIDLGNNFIEDVTALSKFNINLIMSINFYGNYINVDQGSKNRDTIENLKFENEYAKHELIDELELTQKYNKISERNDTLTINEKLKQRLIEAGVDVNNDSIITKGEMNDYNENPNYEDETYKIDLSNLELTNSDIDCLKYLSCVEEIDLSNNNLTDVSPLKHIGRLSTLKLSNNKINLDTLNGFRNLFDLDISNNNIQNIKILGELGYGSLNGYWYGGRFVKLNLSNNKITDVSLLNKIDSLLSADLSNNKIKDISALKNYDFSINENMDGYIETFEIDLSKNYININDKNTKEVVELFKKNYGNIILDNQQKEPEYKLGDVNQDGKINSLDAVEILKYVAKKKTLTEKQLLAADTTRDNKVNSLDAVRILKFVAKKINEI